MENKSKELILRFREISRKDVVDVGGKNASLGEMFNQLNKEGIKVPDGFAVTAAAYWHFIRSNNLLPKLEAIFRKLNIKNIKSLQKTGKSARDLISKAQFPDDLKKEILGAYSELGKKYGTKNVDVAVRTSGVAEDAPTMSFAGQFETYLNVSGNDNLLEAIRKCLISVFTDRAIAYRYEKRVPQLKFALSVGVMKMVRSDLASAGVIFTLDTETGFRNVVLVEGSWGLGEMVVKGRVMPDDWMVFKNTMTGTFAPIISRKLGTKTTKLVYDAKNDTKEVPVPKAEQNKFVLSDKEILTLAKWAKIIEKHYGMPMDIEWAKDGRSKQLFIVQARPETVHTVAKNNSYIQYVLQGKGKLIARGDAVGSKIAAGKARIIPNVSHIKNFRPGDILVTRMTDPDWVSIMKEARAIVTEEGGKTCHAAIVSRELGTPCIVGVRNATRVLKSGQAVTVDCSEGGEGRIWQGNLAFEIKRYDLKGNPKTRTKIMMNVGQPDLAFQNSFLPNSGVGLAREEFITASYIKIHPLALINFRKIKDGKVKAQIEELTAGYNDKKQYFVDKLAEGIGKIAAAFHPKTVIVRLSDFKSNEYARLLGGEAFEPKEENPMIGFRGASRYYDESFKPAFQLEMEAVKKVRNVFGLRNIWLMVPFCRTVEEGQKVLNLIKQSGLVKGKDGLKIIVMCEIPSNVILADKFLNVFDGMSIGSNDLTQLVLGLDRDSSRVSKVGDERNEAVKRMISQVIKVCRQRKKYIGICGEAPSYFPDFAEFLVEQGIESMSLNPDTVIKTALIVAKKEKSR